MNKNNFFMFFIASVVLSSAWFLWGSEQKMINYAHKPKDVLPLFSLSPEKMAVKTVKHSEEFIKAIQAICAIPDIQRTYQNTFQALDDLAFCDFSIWQSIVSITEMVSPIKEIRDAAAQEQQKISAVFIEHVSSNKALYHACKAYVDGNMAKETLDEKQKYFINDVMTGFERAGLHLDDTTIAKLSALKNELVNLGLAFDRNIAIDEPFILVSKQELDGLPESFINNLIQEDGKYKLTVDYPTIRSVLTDCSVASTRKALATASDTRAYPQNHEILQNLIVKRNELAQLLGFETFAQYDLANQMVKTTGKAYDFLFDLLERSQKKVAQEFADLAAIKHPSIIPAQDGKMQPWDLEFAKQLYKKEHYNLDSEKVKEYFPVDQTIQGLFDIYSAFFDVHFKELPINNAWHESVRALQVFTKKNELLGTLFIDLYPREAKYSHACEAPIIPAFIKDGKRVPGVALVIANFPKATATEPALLKLIDVNTFFHEFGHALHELLGANTIASLSGTRTKTDFVELPSQMLEEWLGQEEILKSLGRHYQTGEPMPQEMIDALQKLKQFGTGYFVQRQAYLSLMALDYFNTTESFDVCEKMEELYHQHISHVAYNPTSHFYASFGHLNGYGAKYYGYLWSKVFALDLFEAIKSVGLLNPEIGTVYIQKVLAQGGAKDPNEMLVDFLGRTPNSDAFFRSMGI